MMQDAAIRVLGRWGALGRVGIRHRARTWWGCVGGRGRPSPAEEEGVLRESLQKGAEVLSGSQDSTEASAYFPRGRKELG